MSTVRPAADQLSLADSTYCSTTNMKSTRYERISLTTSEHHQRADPRCFGDARPRGIIPLPEMVYCAKFGGLVAFTSNDESMYIRRNRWSAMAITHYTVRIGADSGHLGDGCKYDSTSIRLQFHRGTTIRRLRYDCSPVCGLLLH